MKWNFITLNQKGSYFLASLTRKNCNCIEAFLEYISPFCPENSYENAEVAEETLKVNMVLFFQTTILTDVKAEKLNRQNSKGYNSWRQLTTPPWK